MTFKYTILSIDGGGIRGLIPALILAEIEKRTGKQTWQLFNLIAGTSTGGILTLGLTTPKPGEKAAQHAATDLVQLYRNEKVQKKEETIFYEPPVERLPSFLGKTDDLLRPKFSSKGRNNVLKKCLGDTLLQQALTEIFITSYDSELRTPIFFTSNLKAEKIGKNFQKLCEDYLMRDAGMATSAAPVFFEPYAEVPKRYQREATEPSANYCLVDGGVFANNPASLAIMEAIISSKKAQQEINLSEILLVSLGTGSLTRPYPYQQAKNWGVLNWVEPLLNIMMDSGSESVACQLEQLLPEADGTPKQYYRFQGKLDGPNAKEPEKDAPNDDLDDTSEQNLHRLEKLANRIIKEKDETGEFDQLCEQLKKLAHS